MSRIDYGADVNRMFDAIEQEFIDICIHNKYNSNEEYIKAIVDYLEAHRDNRDYISYCLDYINFTFSFGIRHCIVTYLMNQKLNKSNEFNCDLLNISEEAPF